MLKNIILKYNNKYITYILMAGIAVLVFFVLGSQAPLLQKDTHSYTEFTGNDAVMPIYPMFYCIFRELMGMKRSFNGMLVAQGIIAAIITIVISIYISRRMKLGMISTIIIYCLSLIPYMVYMPDYNITQIILTEGLSFSMTYLLIFWALRAVYENKFSYIIATLICSAFLYLTRSQMLVAIMFAGVIFFIYLVKNGKRHVIWLIAYALISAIVMMAAYFACILFCRLYHRQIEPAIFDVSYRLERYEEVQENNSGELKVTGNTSQFNRMLWNRGICLIQDEDYVYLDSKEEQEAFVCAIASIRDKDANGLIIDSGIDWMTSWDTQGLVSESNVEYVIEGLNEYYLALYPELSEVELWGIVKADLSLFSKIGITRHFDKLVILYIRLIAAGLQASVFYQPPNFYVMCEIIALIIVILSVFLLVRDRNKGSLESWLLRLSCIGIALFVGIVCAIHLPLQRYLIYFQGFLYMALFLGFKDWLAFVCESIFGLKLVSNEE